MSSEPPDHRRVFVSHATPDRQFVEGYLIPLLEQLGLQPWYSREDIRPSEVFQRQLRRGLESCGWFLVVISQASQESEWVQAEVNWAFDNRWPNNIVPVVIGPFDSEKFHLWLKQIQFVDLANRDEDGEQRLASAFSVTLKSRDSATDSTPETDMPNRAPAVSDTAIASARSAQASPVFLPKFQLGGIVPPEFFIDRAQKLEDAEDILRWPQNFLLVGVRRSGKSSFLRKLRQRLNEQPDNTVLSSILNLDRCRPLTIDTFLGYTINNMIAEVCGSVFDIRPADLERPHPADARPDLERDSDFEAFVDIYRTIVRLTHSHNNQPASPFLPHRFVEQATDLVKLIQKKGWTQYAILYDEAHHISNRMSTEVLEANLEVLNEARLTSVYSVSPEDEESFRPLHELFGHQISIGPFDSQQDLVQLLRRYYYGLPDRDEELPISADALQKVWDYCRGMPFQLQFLLSFSFQQAREQRASLVVDHHVTQAYEHLARERPEYFRYARHDDLRDGTL